MNIGVLCALLSAPLFGISTPFAKLLVGAIAPLMLPGGLRYWGSGIGLLFWFAVRGSSLHARFDMRKAKTVLPIHDCSRRSAGAVPTPLVRRTNQPQTAPALMLRNSETPLLAMLFEHLCL